MRYCLIIDDNDQEEKINTIESTSKERAFPITCYYFNPLRRECLREETLIDGSKEFYIEFELVLLELQKEFGKTRIDLIVSDYQIGVGHTDGLELLLSLKEQWELARDVPTIIYSAKHEEIKDRLKEKIIQISDDKNQLLDFVQNYYRFYPIKISERDTYAEEIYTFLKLYDIPLQKKLSQKLNEHPTRVFKNIFPGFEGLTLKTLANLVSKRNKQSDDFQDEFLDRSISHFIHLEE